MIEQQQQEMVTFPITLPATWCSEHSAKLTPQLRDWLLDPGSLTQRLKQHCKQFKVQVLGQKIEPCSALEANVDIVAGEEVLVREVLLWCDNVPQVFARSLLPLKSLTGDEQKLAQLGTQSLGHVLFTNPKLQRKQIEVACFDSSTKVAQLARSYQLFSELPMWGRRSIFLVEQKPLMVAEVFLPQAFAYQQTVIDS
ncbi:chorismate lyase [Thalassotalea sp. 1_MG-2023]|uniref:chorismate--pyruvate lyase family protein n=1 Tax=Thalassotalea sp. 1_MG-2023 TaxID=3062680 RepID=UPI0026E4269B|nr:chorismate lyase [Thalassotalea sp. 1_MG-2023]MDO6425426.1 chorismate lyase [Thalassotalea sp. 1_MG-2023]